MEPLRVEAALDGDAERSASVVRYYELAKRAEWQVRDVPWSDIPPIPEARGSAEKKARRQDVWRSVVTQQYQADIHRHRDFRRSHVVPDVDGPGYQVSQEPEQVQEYQQEHAVADDAEEERRAAVDSGRHGYCCPPNCSQDTSECQFTNAPVGFGFHAQTCSV